MRGDSCAGGLPKPPRANGTTAEPLPRQNKAFEKTAIGLPKTAKAPGLENEGLTQTHQRPREPARAPFPNQQGGPRSPVGLTPQG
jgi:hypothetical protein